MTIQQASPECCTLRPDPERPGDCRAYPVASEATAHIQVGQTALSVRVFYVSELELGWFFLFKFLSLLMLNITYYLKKNLLVKSEASHLISVTVPTVLEPHGVYLFSPVPASIAIFKP